ncbi:MAG: potassium-transporting ATPase subunit KdpC [Magnetococcales bacterium]|nr:potassium-transporting ATPase subunit KdpC [Magnetococcales bacterium]
MIKELKPAFLMLTILTILTGCIYPAIVTVMAQLLFPAQAVGSLINSNGHNIGSILVGQNFSDPRYFWGRPSATAPMPYNAAASSGSNMGPLNPALEEVVKSRIVTLKESDPQQTMAIPVDLVTSSGSGLDPHISPAAAIWQIPRLARVRGLAVSVVEDLVRQHTEGRTFGVLGEPRVNVLSLNLALDHHNRH